MKRHLIAFATILAACGSPEAERTDSSRSQGPDTSQNANDTADGEAALSSVRVCKASSPTLRLQDGVTYSRDLHPILQRSCASCHSGSVEERQNSTNCFYLRDNTDNVIRRLENAVDAAERSAADPTLTQAQILEAYPEEEGPMPVPGSEGAPLTADELALFRAWAEQGDQCQEGEATPEITDIPVPEHYSSDEEERAPEAFEELFGAASCEEGPDVNTESNWALVVPLLAREASPPSAFYDYAAKTYVAGAEGVPFECTWDALLSSLDGLAGIEPTLRQYEAHGWRLIQCSELDGVPLVGMATLSRVTNTLGDVTYGLNYKTITLEDTGSVEGGTP